MRMDPEDPEAQRVVTLLERMAQGQLSEAEAEELELYAQDDPSLRQAMAVQSERVELGGRWLARVAADQQISHYERTSRVRIERGGGASLVVLGFVTMGLAPVLAGCLTVLGLGILAVSWIRVNHRRDPYKEIQR